MYTSGTLTDLDDPTLPIWSNIYVCRVPQMATLSDAEVSEYGLRVNNIDYLDEEMYEMKIEVGLTINNMLDLWREQYPIRVLKHSDAVKIYDAVHTYLDEFTKVIEVSSLIFTERPDRDLMDLDKFADELYLHVAGELHRGHSNMANDIFGHGLTVRDTAEAAQLKVMAEKEMNDSEVIQPVKKRRTFSNYFEERFNNA